MEDKVERLKEVLKEYEPHLKVWNTIHLEVIDNFIYIMFLEPKHKNVYSSLINEAPIAGIDRIIEIYETKLKKHE